METESAHVTEPDHIKQETPPVSLISSTLSPVLSQSTSLYVPYQFDASPVQSRSNVRRTGGLDSSSMCCVASSRCSKTLRDRHVPPCPPLMFAPDLLASSPNCPFNSGWPHFDRAQPTLPPPPLPLSLFYLPFPPGYSSALPPLVSVPPLPKHWPVQNLLAHYAMMSAAQLPPLLRDLFASNPAALFSQQLATKLPDVGVQHSCTDGAAAARVEGGRMSCDSTATCDGADGGVKSTSSCESTSSPRVVSSTSDDFDYDESDGHAPAHVADVTGQFTPTFSYHTLLPVLR